MKRFITFVQKFWPILLLVVVELILFATNFTPHTYVVGWDNLFPEFNFHLNISRTLSSVWQEYRGLGYEDGLSHAANLPHYLLLWPASFVFPQNLLRYIFIFSMHLLGGVGMYLLLINVIPSAIEGSLAHARFAHKVRDSSATLRFARNDRNRLGMTLLALFGALFYQFNFAVIQMFYLPFEPFITHFGFLPWLLLTMLQYFKTRSRRSLAWFTLLSFLAIPQAHVPTVFLVYLLVLGTFLLFQLFKGRKFLKPV